LRPYYHIITDVLHVGHVVRASGWTTCTNCTGGQYTVENKRYQRKTKRQWIDDIRQWTGNIRLLTPDEYDSWVCWWRRTRECLSAVTNRQRGRPTDQWM